MREYFTFLSQSRRQSAVECLWLLTALLAVIVTLVSCTPEVESANDETATRFQVYFNNDRLVVDPTDCGAVFAVNRTASRATAAASAALKSLFRGPSRQERSEGYHSPFSETTVGLLKRLHVEEGTAYVDLHDLRRALSGATSSCGSAEFRSQIERTLLQFPTIDRVIYAIDGDPRAFYDWMNEPCDPANENCNPAPFRR